MHTKGKGHSREYLVFVTFLLVEAVREKEGDTFTTFIMNIYKM